MIRLASTAHFIALACAFAIALHSRSWADVDQAPIPQSTVAMPVDSGWVRTHGEVRGPAFATVVRVPGRQWLRLAFDDVSLGRTPIGGQPTVIRMTSILDGATQALTAHALHQWSSTSAYFNGDAVLVEIVADPAAPASRFTMSHVTCGANFEPGEGGVANICLGTDDRVASSEAANGRMMPEGCTAWIFNDPNRTFLTAGHCDPGGTSVMQFNVPLSTSGGVTVNPPPEHQYPVDASSVQRMSNGEGDDWCYFGCFTNSSTGLTPHQAQGAHYTLASAPPVAKSPQDLRVTGYGTVESPVSPTLNQVQKTHTGPYMTLVGSRLIYQVDTSPGNSGSPVVDTATGAAIGIHTHGGCTAEIGGNSATATQHPGLQYALGHPRGVCVPATAIEFTFPDGVPDQLDPGGDSVRVIVAGVGDNEPVPGTGVLHLRTGDTYEQIAMLPWKAGEYDAVFPPLKCETSVSFYFTVLTDQNALAASPMLAPISTYSAKSADSIAVQLADDFELDQGWTATSDASLTTGYWQRVVPTATGPRVPEFDGDGSGTCFVTDNAQGADIDGGASVLTSPSFDASMPGALLRYWRWFSTSSLLLEDTLAVQASSDDGASWHAVETYSSTGIGWFLVEVPLADIDGIEPSATFRVRFIASDVGALSQVEAGIDGVDVRTVLCGPPDCPADLNGDGTVSGIDLGAVLGMWGVVGPTPEDIDQDGTVGGSDLGILLAAWGDCPPAP